jgi:hypothetical protein
MPAPIPPQNHQVSERELEQFFGGISTRLNQAARAPANSFSRSQLDDFFCAARRHLDASEKVRLRHDKKRATGFNVFHFIKPDENRLSDVLAFLLDPKASHGQGDVFLRLMFVQLELVVDAKRIQHATVRREAATHNILNSRRRMDIVVDAGAWLAIENKIDSPEQPEQVKDYLEHLHHYTRHSSVRAALIYLSPNGRLPESISEFPIKEIKFGVKLHCWSYHDELRQWLDCCHRDCAAPKIRHFLFDLMAYIEKHFQRKPASGPGIEDYEKQPHPRLHSEK